MLSFYIRHSSAIDIDFKMTLPQQTRHIQDLEEPEAEAQVGPAATEGPHHRVLFPASDADKTDAAADDEVDATDNAPGDRSERGEEGSEAVDAGRTKSIHAKGSRIATTVISINASLLISSKYICITCV